ncbi:hypothetical protein B0T17DRAFT_649836 [Bombardia bombarda]|uniref:Uncharacterized protein n=1 Tax=Bombardia bombarda TaxID=252184 RepID=A0AA39XIS7_9PEZI|nr:hypothetical protein B0T17DRAFT_649836 [Bombardia bombarda]
MSDDAAAEARAAEQARLRKERREAKIKAGGASRLNRITGLGGGIQRDPVPQQSSTASTTTPTTTPTSTQSAQAAQAPRQQQNQAHADPEEVDISQHFYQPQTTARIPPSQRQPQQQPPSSSALDPMNMSEAQLRQMMLSFDGPAPGAGAGAGPGGFGGLGGMGMGMGGGAGAGAGAGMEEDPMMQMMMQMLGGGGPGAPGGAGGFPGMGAFPGMGGAGGDGASPFPFPFPPGAAGGFPGMMGMGGGPAATKLPDRYAALWRLLHTAVALGLGLYIALWTTFSGSKMERESAVATGMASVTSSSSSSAAAKKQQQELGSDILYGSGEGGAGGMIASLAGFLPAPIKGYVEIALRYGQIFSTVKADILVCIFVLGVCSWVRA